MYTQCPHCDTVFEVDAELLAPARGRLCCGACGVEFDALARLAATREALTAAVGDGSMPPVVEPPTDPAQIDLFPAPRRAPTVQPPPPPPSFAATAPRTRGASLRWYAAAAVLLLVLGAQIVFAQRAELATDPRWRAWIAPACARLGCELPPWHEPATITLLSRAIEPHPSTEDALMVSATLRNDARWAQRWPVLELALSDLDGRMIAARRFTVEEYLGGVPERATMAPGEIAVAQIEIVDPGNQAVAFAFEFH